MKFCSKCQTIKAVTEFARRNCSIDGLQVWCRDCRREYQREYARAFRDLDRHRLNQNRYRERNRQKIKAHNALKAAMNAGKVIVPVWCQRCQCVNDLEAHHHDYSKPLAVEWLCTTCHGLEHRTYREGNNVGL